MMGQNSLPITLESSLVSYDYERIAQNLSNLYIEAIQ